MSYIALIFWVTPNAIHSEAHCAKNIRSWSGAAIWTFREFNELPHVLEQRLEPSYEAAENYIKLFGQSEWKAALGRLFVFIGGAFGTVLLLLGVINDAILLHVQLWGRNLLWYAGIAGIIYSIGKALIPAKEAQPSVTRNLFDDMDFALKNVVIDHDLVRLQIWDTAGQEDGSTRYSRRCVLSRSRLYRSGS